MSNSGRYDAGRLADELAEGEVDALLAGVLVDEKSVANMLQFAEMAGLDRESSEFVQVLEKTARTNMLREARKSSHVVSMNAAMGLSDSRVEATGIQLLVNSLSAAADQGVIRGQKGTGKTGAATFSGRELVRDGVVEKVALNYPVRGMTREDLERAAEISRVPDWWLDEEENEYLGELEGTVRFAVNISEFLEFAKEPGEKLATFDEFSSSGNAYTNQADVQAIMSKVINAFRKSPNGSLRTLYIGHKNDSDIHPLVRKQSDVVISKDGKADEGKADMATLYQSWDEYLEEDDWVRIRGLPDVPEESPWRYPSNYFAHLEWDLDDPEMQIQHGHIIEGWEKFQEDDGDDPGNAGEQRQVKCRGTTKDGDGCGTSYVTHESGYCEVHRDQWDGDTDPRLTGDESG